MCTNWLKETSKRENAQKKEKRAQSHNLERGNL